jgi:hypothetical protein
MSNWIKLNLPYSLHEYYEPKSLSLPNLDKRAKKELGFTKKDVEVAGEDLNKFDVFEDAEIIDAIDDKVNKKFSRDTEEQPENITYDKQYAEERNAFNVELAKKSFSGLGLNKPGTLIEVEIDGKLKQYLIGHINPLTGVCDDYTIIVKRYKIVWRE